MLDKDDIKDILAECYNDTAKAAKVLLPERFWRPFDDQLHGQIFDLLDNSDNRLKAIAAPRGTGKTSIINLLLPLKEILFQETHYIVPVSATTDLAMQQSENLKVELMTNELIKALYGPLASENFSKKQWVVDVDGYDICIMPRGAGQQIRGLLYKNHRPGIILVDDLEDPNKVDSEEQREKKKRWFYADLMNCVDRGLGSDWQIIVLGTILHQDSLLEGLLNNPDWDSVRLTLCDDHLNSLAPNFIPTEEVHKIYNAFKQEGQVDVFYREYKNDPVPKGEDSVFPQSLFKDYDPTQVNFVGPEFETMVIVDPAKSTNPKSAHSAVVGVTVNMRTNAIYVRDIQDGKMHPHELYTAALDMVQQLRASVVAIEVTGLHEFATYPLKNEMNRRGIMVEFIELHARGGVEERGKVQRVRSLSPLYRQGLIFHNPQACAVLEQQLMGFPRSKRWDVMDAFGYVSELLEIGERYMLHNLAQEETKDRVELEYADLDEQDYFDPLLNFRMV